LTGFEGLLEIAPGASETIEVGFDPAGLPGGVYSSVLLLLLANDPATLSVQTDVIVTVEPAPGGPPLELRIDSYDPATEELTVSVSRVPVGGLFTFHLRISTDGRTFTPFPGTEFTADQTLTLHPISNESLPTLLVQAFDGPGGVP
ncbi:MAG: hypothetical protein GWO24_26165, partial [Akkermansiaceae bacterium]|nr:hypothetical protein [Akkermansiaceae bacterium]